MRAVDVVRGLPSSQAHELRDGMALGRSEYAVRLGRAARGPGADRDHVQRYLAEVPAQDDLLLGEPVVRLLDAMLLETVARPASSPLAGPADADVVAVPAAVTV